MDWSAFDFWKFLAGLGIFMFGMFLLEEAIKQLSGKAFKSLIRRSTTGKIKSVLTGFFSTAVLQSSSAVSLMTLTFVGAGIISMQNAIGVVLGTNLGTTITSWLVATVGFKINIEGMFLPLLGIGGLGLIFLSSSVRYSGISKLLVGLGFLFMGLDYMKLSVEFFTASIDLATLPHYGLWFYVLLSIILTAIMQSSSATIAIVLTALHSGLMSFDEGAAMVIGANIGTTATVMLGAVGGINIKKQVAFSHLVFNFYSGILAFLLLPILTKLIFIFIDDTKNIVLGITIFHTMFNLIGVLLFLPFIPIFVKWVAKVYPEKETGHLNHIRSVSLDLPEASVAAAQQETEMVYNETLFWLNEVLKSNKTDSDAEKTTIFRRIIPSKSSGKQITFEDLQLKYRTILTFTAQISSDGLEEVDKKILNTIIQKVMILSQITKTIAGIAVDIEELEQSNNANVSAVFNKIGENVKEYTAVLQKPCENEVYILLREQLNHDYKEIVEKITYFIDNKLIKEKHISTLLIVNGIVAQSVRQLIRHLEDTI